MTHSLVGAAIAEAALPGSPNPRRALFYTVGIAAANFPDLDLLYTWITPAPLGYLLHHRGHTHTLGGLVVQAVLLGVMCYALRSVRGLDAPSRNRLWFVVGLGLVSHVLFDAANSYGVHPFWPLNVRWYYGDAVFIFEPWLWLFLAIPIALAVSRRVVRIGLPVFLAVLVMVLGFAGMAPWIAVALLFIVAVIFGWRVARVPHRTGAFVGLSATLLFVGLMLIVSQFAERTSRKLFASPAGSTMLAVVRTPDPTNPVCWSVIGVERTDAAREYRLRPATLSIAPGVVAPGSCKSHRFRGEGPSTVVGGQMIAYGDVRESLDTLHALNARECSVRAWLQFSRAPVITDAEVSDLRFDRGGDNFSAMPRTRDASAAVCPPRLTSWEPPRMDLLRP